jgi:hypothetical protein
VLQVFLELAAAAALTGFTGGAAPRIHFSDTSLLDRMIDGLHGTAPTLAANPGMRVPLIQFIRNLPRGQMTALQKNRHAQIRSG